MVGHIYTMKIRSSHKCILYFNRTSDSSVTKPFIETLHTTCRLEQEIVQDECSSVLPSDEEELL